MATFTKILTILIVIMFSCSPKINVPRLMPVTGRAIVVDAFRYYNGRIFVVKSEIIPGGGYWDAATREPRRKRVWVEIYAAVNHRIELIRIIRATIVPAKPETWEFKEFDGEINK